MTTEQCSMGYEEGYRDGLNAAVEPSQEEHMSKTFTIIVYSDPGHAWGKVKRQVLENLGIADKISTYSYQLRDNVYLEEDCDLSTLVQTLRDNGTSVRFIEKQTDKQSRIRSYERFKSEGAL